MRTAGTCDNKHHGKDGKTEAGVGETPCNFTLLSPSSVGGELVIFFILTVFRPGSFAFLA